MHYIDNRPQTDSEAHGPPLVSLSVVLVGAEATGLGSGSSGAGGGVVAIVYPIHAAIARIKATARKAVICSVISGQPYTNQP